MKTLLFSLLTLTLCSQAFAQGSKKGPRAKDAPSVLLISISSFDKSILKTYGAMESAMPYLDSMANESATLLNAFNSVSWRNLGPALYPRLTVKNFKKGNIHPIGDPTSKWGYRIWEKLKKVSWKLPPWKIKTHRYETDEEIKKRLTKHFKTLPKKRFFSMVHFKRNHIPYVKQESFEELPEEIRTYLDKTKDFKNRLPFLYALIDEKIIRKMLNEPFKEYKNELGYREINKEVYGIVQDLSNLDKWKKSKTYTKDLELLKKYYRISMKGIDDHLKYLLNDLVKIKKQKNLLTIVMGAHGEAFMQHGRLLHGESVYDEEIRIPMFLHYPEVLGTDPFPQQFRLRSMAGVIHKLLMGRIHKSELREHIISLKEQDREMLIVNCQGDTYALRTANSIKIHYDQRTDKYKAFDLYNDPDEIVDVIFHVQRPEMYRLKTTMMEKMIETSKKHDLIDDTSYCPVTL